MKFIPTLLLLTLTFPLFADEALPVSVPPNDPNIRWLGRWDMHDATAPKCSWAGSSVLVKFSGTSLNAVIAFNGQDRFQIIVDGEPKSVLKPEKDKTVYRLVDGLSDGEHTVELFKRTEVFVGKPQIKGFQLEAGKKLVPLPPRSEHRIEIVGDSISCGYGNDDNNSAHHFSNDTENNYMAYGAIAARELKAEYACIAYSGRKMWPDNTTPSIYDRSIGDDANSKWDFSQWIPQVVLINLATNDFGKANPDEKGWSGAYKEFIARVQKNYPGVHIYCAVGTMMSDSYPPGQKSRSTVIGYITRMIDELEKSGVKNVHFLDFGTQDINADGVGGDWHPSIKTHQKMAAKMVAAIKKDLGW